MAALRNTPDQYTIFVKANLKYITMQNSKHNGAKDRKTKTLPVYVGSVKDLISQKIERKLNNDARLILRRKLNGATT